MDPTLAALLAGGLTFLAGQVKDFSQRRYDREKRREERERQRLDQHRDERMRIYHRILYLAQAIRLKTSDVPPLTGDDLNREMAAIDMTATRAVRKEFQALGRLNAETRTTWKKRGTPPTGEEEDELSAKLSSLYSELVDLVHAELYSEDEPERARARLSEARQKRLAG